MGLVAQGRTLTINRCTRHKRVTARDNLLKAVSWPPSRAQPHAPSKLCLLSEATASRDAPLPPSCRRVGCCDLLRRDGVRVSGESQQNDTAGKQVLRPRVSMSLTPSSTGIKRPPTADNTLLRAAGGVKAPVPRELWRKRRHTHIWGSFPLGRVPRSLGSAVLKSVRSVSQNVFCDC